MTTEELRERIRRRAYALWEQEGRPEGRADEYWRRAEAEVTGAGAGEGLPGTSGAGEHSCAACGRTGRVGRKKCTACGGTGRIIEAPKA
jgi:hypothetical protein